MVQVAQGDDLLALAALDVGSTHATHADGCNPQRIAGCLVSCSSKHVTRHDQRRSHSQRRSGAAQPATSRDLATTDSFEFGILLEFISLPPFFRGNEVLAARSGVQATTAHAPQLYFGSQAISSIQHQPRSFQDGSATVSESLYLRKLRMGVAEW